MTGPERGILLLCCRLSDGLQPLTLAQYRKLGELVRKHGVPNDPDAELSAADLKAFGLREAEADRILRLLSRDELLDRSLAEWKRKQIAICTVKSPEYPQKILKKLGDDAPPVLFLKGDVSLLNREGIALVGSRDLTPQGELLAERVGRMAAGNRLVLISGNARGADQTAQNAALRMCGSVVAFVADDLLRHPVRRRTLWVSEDGPDVRFSVARALRRNRLIHCAGDRTFVAQCACGSGGTWDGSLRNLHHGWSQLLVPEDGSPASQELHRLGAVYITPKDLSN